MKNSESKTYTAVSEEFNEQNFQKYYASANYFIKKTSLIVISVLTVVGLIAIVLRFTTDLKISPPVFTVCACIYAVCFYLYLLSICEIAKKRSFAYSFSFWKTDENLLITYTNLEESRVEEYSLDKISSITFGNKCVELYGEINIVYNIVDDNGNVSSKSNEKSKNKCTLPRSFTDEIEVLLLQTLKGSDA